MEIKQLLKLKNQIIAIDLDNTLAITPEPVWEDTTYGEATKIYENLKINKKLRDAIKVLSRDNKIFIYTSRDDYYREVTIAWLCKNCVPFDWLTMKKPIYDLFIDDKVLNIKDLK